jgi:CheY-like chemotaxis protein
MSRHTGQRDELRDKDMAHILIIDDDPPTRRMLRQALEREGYGVIEARDGHEGLQYYRATPTDLIITDILMPDKEGLETIMELRQDFPKARIIAISGGTKLGRLNFLAMAQKLGAQYTLRKPFSLQEMLEIIQKALQD